MKYFKTSAHRTAPRYEINSKVFAEVTGHKQPFEQRNPDMSFSQYGICPSCLNPVQLIGIAKQIKVRPYGKHTGKDVPGLPKWVQLKYEYCPYASNNVRININEDELLPEITEDVVELYDLLKKQFDRVVYIISDELSVRCSFAFWKKALQQYLANNVYCYPWLTEANLPYIFAYRGMQQQNLFGQQFLVGSELFDVLKRHPNVKFEPPKTGNGDYMILQKQGRYLDLQFRFTGHEQRATSGEELSESMLFCVDDLANGDVVYERKIVFSENYFMNLVNKDCNEDKRKPKLLDIANRNMPPLQRNLLP